MSEAALLSVCDVTMRFGGLVAVGGVSFEVARGEVLGVIGPNGAGKTTLFNLLTGRFPPTKGDVRFEGATINRLSPDRRARLGIGRTFQVARPFLSMTALDNVMVGTFLHGAAPRPAQDAAMEVLDRVGLADRAGRPAGTLALAEQRRLEVGRALALKPKLMLLDEVMAGLNPTEIADAIEMFRGLHRDGLTFLVIEHHLKVIRSFSQRVLVLDHGVLIADGAPEAVLEAPEVVTAYLGRRRH